MGSTKTKGRWRGQKRKKKLWKEAVKKTREEVRRMIREYGFVKPGSGYNPNPLHPLAYLDEKKRRSYFHRLRTRRKQKSRKQAERERQLEELTRKMSVEWYWLDHLGTYFRLQSAKRKLKEMAVTLALLLNDEIARWLLESCLEEVKTHPLAKGRAYKEVRSYRDPDWLRELREQYVEAVENQDLGAITRIRAKVKEKGIPWPYTLIVDQYVAGTCQAVNTFMALFRNPKKALRLMQKKEKGGNT